MLPQQVPSPLTSETQQTPLKCCISKNLLQKLCLHPVFFFILLFTLPFTQSVNAAEGDLYVQLQEMETQINLTPAEIYKQLQTMQSQLESADKNTRAIFYLRKLQAENLLYRWSDFDKTLTTGLKELSSSSPIYLQILYKTYQGLSAQRQSNYLDARQYLLEAVNLAESTPYIFAYVYALQELAYTQSLSEKFETALIDLHKAHTLAINSDDLFMVALVEESYGAIFSYMGNYSKSLLHYNKALINYRQLGYITHQAETLLGMGITYRHAKQWQQAVSFLTAYKELTSEFESEYSLFYANYGLAMTYADQHHLKQAKPYIFEALQANGPDDYKAELHKQLALCYAMEGKLEQGFSELKKAQDIFQSIPALEDTSWALETLHIEAQLWQSSGDFEKAYKLLDEYHQKTIALLKRTSSDRLYQMELGMENERKDLQISKLKSEAAADLIKMEAQLKLQKKQNLLKLILGIVFIAILIFAFWQRKTSKKFRELSNFDGLTGIYNRRYILQQLNRLLQNIHPDSGELCLMLADLDDFKSINDKYGHPCGDQVLIQMAKIGRSISRPGDIVARIGGEEFMMLLPRTALAQGKIVAERWRKTLDESAIKNDNGIEISVSTSIGIASFDSNCTTSEELYSRADKALYQAKQAGKNQLLAWSQ